MAESTARGSAPASRSLPELIRQAAAAAPAAEALVVGSDHRTYHQLYDDVTLAARALASIGVAVDDSVAVLLPNALEWIPVTFGALAAGARVDAFNTWVKAYDLDYLLASSGATTLVLADQVRGRDLVGELQTLLPELATADPVAGLSSARYPALRQVVVVGDKVPRGARSWSTLLAEAPDVVLPDTTSRASESAFVLYTSGSTRHPKAVPLCHRDLVVNGFHIGERMGLSDADRVWFGSPLFWSFGCANALMATMTHRACLVLQPEFDAAAAAELMAREQVTAAYLLPPMVNALAASVADQVRALRSLRTGVMIGRPEEVERAAIELGIAEICNIYGSTETYGNCCVTDHSWPLSRRMATQGEPLPGVRVRIADPETGELLPPGTPGELQVRGRITPGYLNDDEANAEAFTADGWFRTGDRMVVDPEGAVTFIGRLSDMIKTSGINVSPAEVESFLSTHPDISEVIVLGAPHPTRDEVVVAFVVPRTDTLTSDEVIRYCKQRLSGYKAPWAVAIVSELPHTSTGKLVRKDLRGAATEIVEAALVRGAS